ncbi:endonuclease III domain-containing protein [Candidatus Bipolaricaulota sp. J31]
MDPKEKMAEVADRLHRHYGPIQWRPRADLLSLLVGTILSQNTSDLNRDRAFSALRERFPRWEEILEAPIDAVEEAIRGAGLHRQRAMRIKEILNRIVAERGEISLEFLREMAPEEAHRWLLSLPGVGRKTAGIVLLFGMGAPYFPVDTHIKRVTRRLGLWDGKGDPHDVLGPLVPREKEYELHLHLIRLGRELCRPRNPRCGECPLRDLCDSAERGQ